MKDTLIRLLKAHGATGHEEGVVAVIKEMISDYVDEMRVDAMGNLIATKKGAGKRIMLAAHMDQIGYIVTNIDDKGFIRVHNLGGIARNVVIGQHVTFENGTRGVLYFDIQNESAYDIAMTRFFIDIGATTKEEASKKVKLGDVAVHVPTIAEMGNRISAPAMDDRAGCAVAVEVLKQLENCPNEVIAVFTVQEEVGLRGAKAAAFDVNPDMGIALDVTLCGDTPKGHIIAVELGKGPTVKIMDSSLICNPIVVAAMEAAASKANIPYQREVLTAGGTDSGAIQLTRGGIPSGVISIPCRYVHTPTEMIDLGDAEGAVKLLVELLMQA